MKSEQRHFNLIKTGFYCETQISKTNNLNTLNNLKLTVGALYGHYRYIEIYKS